MNGYIILDEFDDYWQDLDEDDWLSKWQDDIDSLNLNLSLDIYMQLPTNMQLHPR
jgi:hypothetical protein